MERKFKVGDRVTHFWGDGVICIAENGGNDRFQYRVAFPDGVLLWVNEGDIKPTKLHRVIFVTHMDDSNDCPKKYIFGVPENATIKTGDWLCADTRFGQRVVTAVCEPFKINEHGLNQLSKVLGGKSRLRYVTSKAVLGFKEKQF